MVEAKFYKKGKGLNVVCMLCPKHCKISNGESGKCQVRTNINGILYATSYGAITSIALDPISKKPLARYETGKNILSIGSYGCNFTCPFCQNYTISMQKPYFEKFTSQDIVEIAKTKLEDDNIGVAYTYNEPLINYEFLLDTCKEVKKANLKNVLVTNGCIEEEPLLRILPYIDAINVDLKFFVDEKYLKYCTAKLSWIQRFIETVYKRTHLEVTMLMITDINDSVSEVIKASKYLASLSDEIVLHLTRFYPRYLLNDRKPTSINKILLAEKEARKYLKYVYTGNF